MSFLGRFTKKKKQEQLENFAGKPTAERPSVTSVSRVDTEPRDIPTGASHGGYAKILAYPVVSEKAAQVEGNSVYTFVVARDANKFSIRRAIAERYGVIPKKIRVMHYDGKRLRFGKNAGQRRNWKKAMVTLPKGKTIQVHEGV